MDHSSSVLLASFIFSIFSVLFANMFANMAPDTLCQTLNTAPGTVASGYAAKWTAAREDASPEFCIPTSIDTARHLVVSIFAIIAAA